MNYAEIVASATPTRKVLGDILSSEEEELAPSLTTLNISVCDAPNNNIIESLFEEMAQVKLQMVESISDRIEFRTPRIVGNQCGIHGCSQQLCDVA